MHENEDDIMQQVEQEIMQLNGKITFATVVDLRKKGEQLFAKRRSVMFDFSGVTSCDSAALALLLAFKRAAKQKHVRIAFSNLPKSLRALMALCNVSSIIQET